MKKKLEAELISIAHRILKLKNKSDIIALHQETQKLYEKLSVLRFVEESYGDVKPTIGTTDIESHLEEYFDNEPEVKSEPTIEDQPEVVAAVETPAQDMPEVEETPQIAEENQVAPEAEESETDQDDADRSNDDVTEPETEEVPEVVATEEAEDNTEQPEETEIEDIEAETESDREPEPEVEAEPQAETEEVPEPPKEEIFTPSFELSFDRKSDEDEESKPQTPSTPQFSFDDLLGKDYADPVFVKPDEVKTEKKFSDYTYKDAETIKAESRSLNDRLSKGITIGLNDRIAFIKHLFADSSEDYNRVLSQLMTFDTHEEAKGFIDDIVKPDYNDWEGKEEYAERFMDIVEKRFI